MWLDVFCSSNTYLGMVDYPLSLWAETNPSSLKSLLIFFITMWRETNTITHYPCQTVIVIWREESLLIFQCFLPIRIWASQWHTDSLFTLSGLDDAWNVQRCQCLLTDHSEGSSPPVGEVSASWGVCWTSLYNQFSPLIPSEKSFPVTFGRKVLQLVTCYRCFSSFISYFSRSSQVDSSHLSFRDDRR